jgi:hypothetical protein
VFDLELALMMPKGKARLEGVMATECDQTVCMPDAAPPMYPQASKNLPILGVAHRIIEWSGGRTAKAASALIPVGERTDGFVIFDDFDQGTSPSLSGQTSAGAIGEASPGGASPSPGRAVRSR